MNDPYPDARGPGPDSDDLADDEVVEPESAAHRGRARLPSDSEASPPDDGSTPSIGSARVALGVVVFGGVFYFLVLPLLANFGDTWDTLRSIDPWWGFAAVGVQAVMWYFNGQSIRLLLPSRSRPTRWVCFGSAVAAEGISHVIPAGAAGTAVVNYNLMRKSGAPNDELVYALSTSGVVSVLVLNLMLSVSLAFAIPQAGPDLPYPIAIGLGLVFLAVVGGAAWTLLARTGATARLIGRLVGWIPSVDGRSVDRGVRRFAADVRALLIDPKKFGQLLALSALRWLIGSLVAFIVFAAIGTMPNLFALFVAFALANVMAAIPISPGGLGIYEATMIAALVAFGSPRAAATAGVLAFRAINFWLPIPLGGLAYVGVQRLVAQGHGLAPRARAKQAGPRAQVRPDGGTKGT